MQPSTIRKRTGYVPVRHVPKCDNLHFGLKLYKDDEVYGVDVDDTRHMWNILVFKSRVCVPDMGYKDAGVYVAPFLNLQEGISLGDHFKGFLLSIPFSSWRVFDIYNLERQFMSSSFGPFVDLGEKDVDLLCMMMNLMESTLNGVAGPYNDMELKYLCRAVISTLGRYYGVQCAFQDVPATGNRYVDAFLQLVEKNCLKERKLDFYARQLGVSSRYLSMLVSKTTGKRAGKWISDSVIEIANNQLCSTSSPISEIAEKVGFANCSDFCKFYKSNTGVSPQKYRREIVQDT